MNKYQTPTNEIIEGSSVESAIRNLRERNGHKDSYYDICYNWRLHEDGIHLVDIKVENSNSVQQVQTKICRWCEHGYVEWEDLGGFVHTGWCPNCKGTGKLSVTH